jgi:hypothetical protein
MAGAPVQRESRTGNLFPRNLIAEASETVDISGCLSGRSPAWPSIGFGSRLAQAKPCRSGHFTPDRALKVPVVKWF